MSHYNAAKRNCASITSTSRDIITELMVNSLYLILFSIFCAVHGRCSIRWLYSIVYRIVYANVASFLGDQDRNSLRLFSWQSLDIFIVFVIFSVEVLADLYIDFIWRKGRIRDLFSEGLYHLYRC